MTLPLMPTATAVWLVENTVLTFEQIAAFCGMHPLEVQAIADGEVAAGMLGLDPFSSGQLTQAEIDRCAADPDARLTMEKPTIPQPQAKAKGARYTPVSKRQDRPDAIAWLLKSYPELGDAQISGLIGTTKPTINAVRDKTHWNSPNIKPQNPVGLGLCAEADLEKSGEPGACPRRRRPRHDTERIGRRTGGECGRRRVRRGRATAGASAGIGRRPRRARRRPRGEARSPRPVCPAPHRPARKVRATLLPLRLAEPDTLGERQIAGTLTIHGFLPRVTQRQLRAAAYPMAANASAISVRIAGSSMVAGAL